MRFIIFIVLLSLGFLTQAQQIDASFNPSENFIPKSPEASTIMMFQDLPTNPYTGTASVSVPIASVSEHDLSVNLSLQYHTSSIPVNTVSNWVGANWKLNGVCMITRKVRGLPDDANLGTGFLIFRDTYNYEDSDSNPNNSVLDWLDNEDVSQFEELASGCVDASPDEFYFDLNGAGSGTFAFDWENEMPIISSASDVKIISYETTINGQIIEWKLQDAKGVIYTFADQETTDLDSGFTSGNPCSPGNQLFTSSWYLSRMESPNIVQNGQPHYIEFQYQDYTLTYDWNWYETRYFGAVTNDLDICPLQSPPSFSRSRSIIEGKRLSAIRTANNYFSIDLIANNIRTDIQELEAVQNFYRLDEIQVKGAAGELMHRYALDYEYKGRLLLKSVQQIGSDGLGLPPYIFDYHDTPMPAVKSKSVDHWGFFNGEMNTTVLPSYLHRLTESAFIYFEGAKRAPSLPHALANVMTKVTYPTGGKVVLDYELNEYSFINHIPLANYSEYKSTIIDDKILKVTSEASNTNCIEEISPTFSINSPEADVLLIVDIRGQTANDVAGSPATPLPQVWIEDQNGNPIETYQLEADENYEIQAFTRYLLVPPGTYRLRAKAQTFEMGAPVDFIETTLEWTDIDASTPLIKETAGGVRLKNIIYQDGNSVETNRRSFSYQMDDGTGYTSGVIYARPNYSYEASVITSRQASNNQTELYVCDNVYLAGGSNFVLSSTSGSYIGYRRVEESIGINGEGGKIVHVFRSPYHSPDVINTVKPFGPPLSNSFQTGLSSGQTFYDKNGVIVQQTSQNFNFPFIDIPRVKVSYGRFSRPGPNAPAAEHSLYGVQSFDQKFAWSFNALRLGLSLPSSTTTWLDGVNQTTNYTYDSQYEHHQPISTTTTNSDGKVHRTDTKYAYETSTDATVTSSIRAIATAMIGRNMVAIPLEQRKYVDGVLQGGGRTEYGLFLGKILPKRFVQILHTDEEVERGTIAGYTADAYPTATTRRGYPQRTYIWTNGLLDMTQYGTWTESFSYFPNTRLRKSYTAIDGQVTNLTYDGLQRLKTASSRGGAVVSTNDYHYTYATEGSPNYVQSKTVFSDNTPSQTTIQTFDGTGRGLKTLVNGVLKNEIIYDQIGRVDRQTHLPGNFTSFEYDDSPLNRVKKQTFPATSTGTGFFTQTDYGSENGYFKTIFTDENLNQTITLTDILGRTERIVNADGNATIYEYNDRDLPTKIIPPLGNQTSLIFEYEYDARNRKTHISIPGAGQKVLTYYDTHDLLHTQTDANGNELEYFYDQYGREIATHLDGSVIRSSFYDENGGINVGKMTRSQVKILGATNFLETAYQYDSFGRLQQTTADNHIYNMGQQGSDIMTTTYNHADWVTNSLRNHIGYENIAIAQSFDYDNFGRNTQTTHSINGQQGAILSNNGWNNRDQMTRKVIGGNLQSVDYLYNERGFLSRINQPLDLLTATSSPRACDVNFVETGMSIEEEMFCGLQEIDLNTLLNLRFDEGIAFDCYNPCENTGGVQGQPDCDSQEQSDQLATVAAAQNLMQIHYTSTTTQNCDDGSTQEVIRPNVSSLNLPTTLYRIRLCNPDGHGADEVFIFEDALSSISGTYYIVQEIEIVDVRQLFTIQDNQGINQSLTLEQLLLMVVEGDNMVVGDYQHNSGSCEPTPPDCTPEEIADQQNALSGIMGTGFQAPNTDNMTFPTALHRVMLCDGTETYLFEEELAQMPGTYTILQTIGVMNAQQMFNRGTTITNLDLNDLFCLGLYYAENNPGDDNSRTRKNGDISWMTWQTKGNSTQNYTFRYDKLNRLKNAFHAYIDMDRNYVFNKHYDVSLSYDANGNITNLSRNRMPTAPNDCGVLMDDLSYEYDYAASGNRLLNIEDIGEADKGFKHLNGAGNYQYDLNGNLTRDFHKGYTASYNYLNLPELFNFGRGLTVGLLYDAAGTKLRKTVTGTENYVKEYCQGIEYKDGVLEAIYHSEGRVIRDGNGELEYQYVLKDHLGNNRVMFADADKNGVVEESEIIQESHYYPFGEELEGDWNNQTSPEQNYLYNGKELDSDYGLKLYHYGFRMYDALQGRFTGVDPISDQFPHVSTFNYAENSPIANIDLHGLQKFNVTQFDRNRQNLTKESKAAFQQGQTKALKFVADVAAGEIIPGYDEGKAISEGNYGEALLGAIPLAGAIRKLQKRVDALETALGPTGKRITIGGGMDLETGDISISTSEPNTLRKAMKNAMEPNETFVRGQGHAEIDLLNSDKNVDVIVTSKPACIECEIEMREANVVMGSEPLNDFSRKRKRELSSQEKQQKINRLKELRNNSNY